MRRAHNVIEVSTSQNAPANRFQGIRLIRYNDNGDPTSTGLELTRVRVISSDTSADDFLILDADSALIQHCDASKTDVGK
jgi:hypothetical protein